MALKMKDLAPFYIKEQLMRKNGKNYISYVANYDISEKERMIMSEEYADGEHELSPLDLCLDNYALEHETVLNNGLREYYSNLTVKNFLDLLCESLDLENFSSSCTAYYGEKINNMFSKDVKNIYEAFDMPDTDKIYYFKKTSLFGIKSGYAVTNKGVYLKNSELIKKTKSGSDIKFISFNKFKNSSVGASMFSIFIDDIEFETGGMENGHICSVLFMYRLREYCKYKYK